MTRIATPFDAFMADLTAWLDSAWFVWIIVAATVAIVVVTVTVSKARARSRARQPQYRRQT